ncbi:hypothetical protein V8C86DRAFT_967933 [Haematococcus lacustris]
MAPYIMAAPTYCLMAFIVIAVCMGANRACNTHLQHAFLTLTPCTLHLASSQPRPPHRPPGRPCSSQSRTLRQAGHKQRGPTPLTCPAPVTLDPTVAP